jgi:hypothetical protein
MYECLPYNFEFGIVTGMQTERWTAAFQKQSSSRLVTLTPIATVVGLFPAYLYSSRSQKKYMEKILAEYCAKRAGRTKKPPLTPERIRLSKVMSL